MKPGEKGLFGVKVVKVIKDLGTWGVFFWGGETLFARRGDKGLVAPVRCQSGAWEVPVRRRLGAGEEVGEDAGGGAFVCSDVLGGGFAGGCEQLTVRAVCVQYCFELSGSAVCVCSGGG